MKLKNTFLGVGLVALMAACTFAGVPTALRAQAVATTMPTTVPTTVPTTYASTAPTTAPTTKPTTKPTTVPTTAPTTAATTIPAYATSAPTTAPTTVPTTAATTVPTTAPTTVPTSYPTEFPGTPPPLHVATLEHTAICSVCINTSPSVYAPYLTYAYVKTDHDGLWQKAGIKIIQYTNPVQPICTVVGASGCTVGDTSGYDYLTAGGQYNSTAAKDCSGNTITGWYGANKYPAIFVDPRTSTASTYFQAVEDNAVAYEKYANPGYTRPWDIFFVDNVGGGLYNPSATPCNQSQPAWNTALGNMIGATTDGPYWLNNMYSESRAGVDQNMLTGANAQVSGENWEECYGGNTPNDIIDYGSPTSLLFRIWDAAEYAETKVTAIGKQFICLNRLVGDPTTAQAQSWRIYTYASFLLSYDYNLGVYETEFSSNAKGSDTINVMPEEMFVPMNPTFTATDPKQYQANSTSAYMRSWSDCHYQGWTIGPCAVVVNPTNTTLTVTSSFNHSLTVQGGAILDGGTASILGPKVLSLAQGTAAILTP